jgi:hypothetical protein
METVNMNTHEGVIKAVSPVNSPVCNIRRKRPLQLTEEEINPLDIIEMINELMESL